MMFNGDDDGDLMSLVRSCSREKGKAPDSSTYPPPPAVAPPPLPTPNPTRTDDSWPPTIFPNPSAYFGGLEEVLMPFFPQPPQPQPLQQTAGGGVVPTSTRTPRTPKQAPTRASIRKNQQKKVVTQVPVDNSTSNDNWAWRKYGQKPIKGSPYPRGYYRCSTSKSCPARKQVERSRTDPGMFIVSYAEEHNHPLPTHRNSLAGMARNKYSASSSEAAGGAGLPSGLSPTTPLTTSQSMEEEEEEDDEGMELDVGDIEVVGDDELVFMGDATMPKDPAAVQYSLLFDGAEDACFSMIWSGNNGGN